MILTILFAIKIPKTKDEDEEDVEIKRYTNIIPILISIASVLIFIFTENVRLPMIMIDNYTLAMFILAVGGLITSIFTRDKKKKEEKKSV